MLCPNSTTVKSTFFRRSIDSCISDKLVMHFQLNFKAPLLNVWKNDLQNCQENETASNGFILNLTVLSFYESSRTSKIINIQQWNLHIWLVVAMQEGAYFFVSIMSQAIKNFLSRLSWNKTFIPFSGALKSSFHYLLRLIWKQAKAVCVFLMVKQDEGKVSFCLYFLSLVQILLWAEFFFLIPVFSSVSNQRKEFFSIKRFPHSIFHFFIPNSTPFFSHSANECGWLWTRRSTFLPLERNPCFGPISQASYLLHCAI